MRNDESHGPALTGYHRHEAPAFDGDGEPVGTVDFDYGAIDGPRMARPRNRSHRQADERRLRLQTIQRTLQWLASGRKATPKVIGQRVQILAHLTQAHPRESQKDLAKRLGISGARVSQILNYFRRLFAENQ